MSYIVAWTVIEEQKRKKKNTPIQLYEIKRTLPAALRRYNELVKTDALVVVIGAVITGSMTIFQYGKP